MGISILQPKKERRPKEHVYSVLEKGIFVPTEVSALIAFGRTYKVTSNVGEHSVYTHSV